MVGWCTLFLTAIGKEAPAEALDEDLEERERNHWWKAKKWAYANLNRLFVRYVILQRLWDSSLLTLEPEQIWQPYRASQEYRSRACGFLKIVHRKFCT